MECFQALRQPRVCRNPFISHDPSKTAGVLAQIYFEGRKQAGDSSWLLIRQLRERVQHPDKLVGTPGKLRVNAWRLVENQRLPVIPANPSQEFRNRHRSREHRCDLRLSRMQGGARAIQPVADSFGEHLLPCGGRAAGRRCPQRTRRIGYAP